MRVVAKLATGTAVVVALLVAVLIYDLAQVRRIASVSEELPKINFRVATITLEQQALIDEMEEFAQKLFVTGDPGYATRLRELVSRFEGKLTELGGLELTARERRRSELLDTTWLAASRTVADEVYPWETAVEIDDEGEPVDAEVRLGAVMASLDRLRGAVQAVALTARSTTREQVAGSIEASRRAGRWSWSVAAAAVGLSLLILGLIVRSINKPLRQLVAGTRAVAEGEFSHQLPVEGNDEFTAVARSFNGMVERLAELDRLKADFLSHVSHELKTPLVAMQETNELLLEEIPGHLNEKQRRFLELNLDGSRRLSAMISHLLDLARLEEEAVEYDFAPHDLGELLATVAAEFEARARERDVRLTFDRPPVMTTAHCDHERMLQVVENLVENGLKFSAAGGFVHLSISDGGLEIPPSDSAKAALDGGASFVVIAVTDSGPGVPDADKARVFDKFQQLDGVRADEGSRGVGLGLAICRNIVEAHRGVIWVEDNDGPGSTFFVGLRRAPVADGRQKLDRRRDHVRKSKQPAEVVLAP